MKSATSNLTRSCGLLRPIINPTRRKSSHGSGLGELPEIWGLLLIFLQRLKIDFRFGTQLEFAKAHHKITPRRTVGVVLG